MPGLSSLQSDYHSFAITHLAHQNYFRRLPQGGTQSQRKVGSVRMQLALMDGGILVLVQELNRILDSNDVIELCLVNEIDDSGQRRTLATASRTRYQHDPILQFDNLAQLVGQIKVVKARRARRNHSHDNRVGPTLFENIDAKTAQTGHPKGKIG